MKEKYFTVQNIDEKAKSVLSEIQRYSKCSRMTFDLKTSALLVLDMQKYFIDQGSHAYIPSVEAIIPKIQSLISLYKQHNLPIIFTRHENTAGNAGLMSVWWKDLLKKNTPESCIIPELCFENMMVILKSQYDAFYNTTLERILRDNNITQLVVTGVMTHLCCETTIRSAFVRGFNTFLPIDATATYNEKFYVASLRNLTHGFTIPVLADDLAQSCALKQLEKI